MQEQDRAAAEYLATLSGLDSNSKIEINALTMLADDYREFAIQIVKCITQQLRSSPPKKKLPVLYLIDSICKNFPESQYVQLFTQNIVSNFCNVFEVSDEKVRKSLHKLRMTWKATKIFPEKKLEAIDERVHEMDPNWPILHKLASNSTQTASKQSLPQQQQPQQTTQKQATQPQPLIRPQTRQQHQLINQQQPQPPQGQQQQQQQQQALINPSSNIMPNQTGGTKRASSQSNGRRKRAKGNRGNNNNNNVVNNNLQPISERTPVAGSLAPTQPVLLHPPTFIDPNTLIQVTHDPMQVHPTQFLDPSITMGPTDSLHQPVPAPAFIEQGLILGPPEQQPLSTPQLMCAPFNSQALNNQPPPTLEPPPAPHLAVLESLYGGKQCSNCSLRFDDNNRYASHLDWHFRQNLKSDNILTRRKWYYPLNLWVQFREIDDDDLQENTNPDVNVNDMPVAVDENEVPSAPASKDDEKNICSVCHETFEKFWAEEEEEWRLKNAIAYKDERVYHPPCLMDMLQANNANTSELMEAATTTTTVKTETNT